MRHAIAIDIGGTKTLGALFDEEAHILCEKRIATDPKMGPDHLMSSICQIIEELSSLENIDCIAVASAGRINTIDGSVFYASDNIPGWNRVKIKSILEGKYKLPVFVENDCKAAGLGEEWQGSAKGRTSYLMIVIGTGIGAAVKADGTLLHGAHWSAGEIGHMTLYPNGRKCNCGMKGCFEQYCSGPALVHRYNELTENNYIHSGYELFERFEKGDKVSKRVVDEFTTDMSVAVSSLCNIYDPEITIIGGGLSEASRYWWSDFAEKVNSSGIRNQFNPAITTAKLGNKAGIYGAAYLGFQSIRNHC